eukprot:CAMPEP_0204821180 /NCGR_PEP_ID=MMETSP1018-20131115/4247_1 /ASSEMBLY_ACC=CAM_ASM_000518 /TAXON_ID=46462 /ORGANISM="Anophryoides haemophila, Strain AH6" /LENGTH=91 /DNA_ID=CAMNT_0051921681 /DNA_START=91 /DNA_END=366 /DNA_ORIENTATION=+
MNNNYSSQDPLTDSDSEYEIKTPVIELIVTNVQPEKEFSFKINDLYKILNIYGTIKKIVQIENDDNECSFHVETDSLEIAKKIDEVYDGSE